MNQQASTVPFNRFRNNAKAIELGASVFAKGEEAGVMRQVVRLGENDRLVTQEGHSFVNFSSCDYLGLHRHPKVVKGAADNLLEQGFYGLSISVVRVCPESHYRLEQTLAEMFNCNAILGLTCSAISQGILPLCAAGTISEGVRPFMIFDKHSHFSMAITTPLCGDETDVVLCEHNDLNFIEDMCKKHPVVMYVGDGTYSMGGQTMIKELMRLQEQYGLYLYLDDSHSISLYGKYGCGFARTHLPDQLNERTLVVGSLAKAFGAGGGVLMSGLKRETETILRRFGGPLGWSQNLSSATLGAGLASAAIHRSEELVQLQQALRDRLALFDSLIPTKQAGADAPIRLVNLGKEELAIEMSSKLFERGFYSSAVFFPIVARGKAGVRVMLRANTNPEDVKTLCGHILELGNELGVST